MRSFCVFFLLENGGIKVKQTLFDIVNNLSILEERTFYRNGPLSCKNICSVIEYKRRVYMKGHVETRRLYGRKTI